jgi:D-glycero-alpha-D-manno-heptose 1-phosphate guanylyltransferase
MITEAIVLAGGIGSRLRPVVADLPKCLAFVDGRPFLYFIIEYLKRNGITNFIFSLGYKSEAVQAFLESNLLKDEYILAVEEEPLGTGGAIQFAANSANQKNSIVVNGDTFFDVDLKALSSFHKDKNAECTVCLKPMEQFSRYGVVELDEQNTIISFKEKQFFNEGLINGGVYVLNKERFLQHNLPEKFSFEKDYLERFITHQQIKGLIQDKYFIDIGVPEDYAKAQTEMKLYNNIRDINDRT